jgi:hypothetical protein
MTDEELVATGLPLDPVAERAEHATPAEDSGSPSGSRSREDGEVRSDGGEDIGDVDAGVDDLIRARTSGPLPPHSPSESRRLQATRFVSTRRPDSSPLALGVPHLMS